MLFERTCIRLPEHTEIFAQSRPESHTYTRAEIDEMVHGIYRAMGTSEDYFTKGLDDVYYPSNNSI